MWRRPLTGILILGLVSACSSSATARNASPSSAPTPSPTATATPAAASLVSRLIPLPTGATPHTGAWASNLSPAATQFADQFYPPSDQYSVVNDLSLNQLTGIAHRDFIASDGSIADVILMSFSTDAEASTRYYNVSYQLGRATGGSVMDLAGFTEDEAQAAHAPSTDSYGYVFTRAAAHRAGSRIMIQIDSYSKGRYDPTDLLTWLTAQYTLTG